MGSIKRAVGKFLDDVQTKRARNEAVRKHMNDSRIPWNRRVQVVKKTEPKKGR